MTRFRSKEFPSSPGHSKRASWRTASQVVPKSAQQAFAPGGASVYIGTVFMQNGAHEQKPSIGVADRYIKDSSPHLSPPFATLQEPVLATLVVTVVVVEVVVSYLELAYLGH